MFLRSLLVVLSLAYPAVVYYSDQQHQVGFIWPLIFGLILIRLWLGRSRLEKGLLLLVAIGVGLLMFFSSIETGLKLYPVLVNLALLVLFGSSLFQEQTLVERLARIREPDLPEDGVRYTRKVTGVWTGFFVLNGTLALVTAVWTSNAVWALYNGLIAYVLMGLLMSGEWLIRIYVRKNHAASE
ncbi:COG4648 family protein [Marinobacter mangrovi]|uniref:COG4648 family protein n=1 Tax=Marinobacter mangrovi TaxID=2803918 RepID=UPI0019333FA4|nr:hypothetical protein [Marinobacter mangrovi]